MGFSLFLRESIKLVKERGYISICFGASYKEPERFLKIQDIINSHNLVIEEKINKFNKYNGAESIGSASSTYLLKTTKKTSNELSYISENEIYTYQKRDFPSFP